MRDRPILEVKMEISHRRIRQVEFSECDMYGIMHHIEYMEWLGDELERICKERKIDREVVTWDCTSRFLRALRWGDRVEIVLNMGVKDGALIYRGSFKDVKTDRKVFLFSGRSGGEHEGVDSKWEP